MPLTECRSNGEAVVQTGKTVIQGGFQRDQIETAQSGDILALGASHVAAALEGRDAEVISAISHAYAVHASGDTSLPHSAFVHLPERGNRIIALPAYLGGEARLAGIKWIASVPANIERGMDRASAVMILNDVVTGRPAVLLEGALISARRTAGSAILMAARLEPQPDRMALIGCGYLNYEIARMACATFPSLREFVLFDIKQRNAETLRCRLERHLPAVRCEVRSNVRDACQSATLVSFATTASEPHIKDVAFFLPGAAILHVSLRDLSPEVLLACDNITDDIDHVCRANTSAHLTEKRTGSRAFLRCSAGEIITGRAPARINSGRPVVFSPFGLGILDLAVAGLAVRCAKHMGIGSVLPSFLGEPWRAPAYDASVSELYSCSPSTGSSTGASPERQSL